MIGGFIYPGSYRKKRPIAGKKSKKKYKKHTIVKKHKNKMSKKRTKTHKKKYYKR